MKLNRFLNRLDSLLSDRIKQLEYLRSPEAKLFLEGQIALLRQIKKEVRKT